PEPVPAPWQTRETAEQREEREQENLLHRRQLGTLRAPVKTIVEALAVIAAASPEDQQYCLKVLERVSWRTLWRLADDEEKQRQLAGTLRDVGFVLMRSGTS